MKIKTSELTGAALDWAVAKCEGYEVVLFDKLFRDNAAAKGYDPVKVEQNLAWAHQRGRHVIVELRNLQLDQFNPENLTPTRCAVDIPNYSTDWAQAGLIIDREIFKLFKNVGGTFTAQIKKRVPYYSPTYGADIGMEGVVSCSGPTPLIATMRCYVASKLGDEVEIPEELAS